LAPNPAPKWPMNMGWFLYLFYVHGRPLC
jgi:hypothetical protein